MDNGNRSFSVGGVGDIFHALCQGTENLVSGMVIPEPCTACPATNYNNFSKKTVDRDWPCEIICCLCNGWNSKTISETNTSTCQIHSEDLFQDESHLPIPIWTATLCSGHFCMATLNMALFFERRNRAMFEFKKTAH